ncbi:nucleotidyltransferase domain-containing protein [Anaerobacillus alkaliphilus]|uniref:Nucleotidyltransferase domain-containing protein n=1 Tax=Anaerobacillus alkaliphilus TaxID=1548597 RepID=A0A4Q0VW41_9BACI|nr:nucleotidyltransferase domain-containing protein [Anaerobacillus alkaliphilus]RXJ02399.1 nucleotidyltransferase domain-containing protein [Anaerobacillus alkaliphilus]
MEQLPIHAAKKFVSKFHPNCDAALLAGSVVSGQATATSDLDIVIFDRNQSHSYRESLVEFGWPIEVFVHNLDSYKPFFVSDCERARPTLPRMVSEGVILKDNGIVVDIKNEANELLAKGPEKWSGEIIRLKRYFITDALDDLLGATDRSEELQIANTLTELVSEFVLRTNGHWIGSSKWVMRTLKQFDEQFAQQYFESFDLFYRTGDKADVADLVEDVLRPYGGRLFEGFSIGKNS